MYLWVLCGTQNKLRLFPHTTLTDWFVWPRWSVFTARYGLNICIYEICPKSNENDLKYFFVLNIHAITVYSLQNGLLVNEHSDSSVAATLHSSGESLHLWCCSKPSSLLPERFQLSLNDVLWGGFWSWEIKRNRTEPSQGSTVGGEALWYYVELKIASHRMMCDLALCRGEWTTCLQFHGGRAHLRSSTTWVLVGKMFD